MELFTPGKSQRLLIPSASTLARGTSLPLRPVDKGETSSRCASRIAQTQTHGADLLEESSDSLNPYTNMVALETKSVIPQINKDLAFLCQRAKP